MIPTVIVHSPVTTNTDLAATDTPEHISGNTQCETQSNSTTSKQHLSSNHEKVRYYSYTMDFSIKSAGT